MIYNDDSIFFEYIIEQIEEAILVADVNHKITYINTAHEKMYGYAKEELTGKSPSVLYAEKYPEEIIKNISEELANKKSLKIFHRCHKKDGTIFIVEKRISCLKDVNGNLAGYISINRDVTAEKMTSQNAQMAIKILKLLNEKSGDKYPVSEIISDIVGIIKYYTEFDFISIEIEEGDTLSYYVNNDNKIKCDIKKTGDNSRNKENNDIFKYIRELVMEGKEDETCLTCNGSFWTNNVSNFLESNKLKSIDTKKVCNYGYESIALIPLKSNSKIIGFLYMDSFDKNKFSLDFIKFIEGVAESIGIAIQFQHHIEKIILSERALREFAKETEDKNRELEQFAYITSHDLQEPLRIVSSYTQLIYEEFKDEITEENEKYFKYVLEFTERMSVLIKELLDFSRVGRKDAPFEKINMEEVYGEVLEDYSMKIKETGATLRLENSLPTICGIRIRIKQLIANLISNSLKYHSEDAPEIVVGCFEEESEYIFWVKDNGIGIDPIYFERIFGIFKRLYSREKYPGTGIGLALCQRIVEAHGGKIWVDSHPGEGSIFYFKISKFIDCTVGEC